MTAEQQKRRKAWDFADGIIKVDGLSTSDEMNVLIEREIRGEITTEDIKKALDSKYRRLGSGMQFGGKRR